MAAMMDFIVEAWSIMSWTSSPCALQTIVAIELAPHSCRAERKREGERERGRERGREGEREQW